MGCYQLRDTWENNCTSPWWEQGKALLAAFATWKFMSVTNWDALRLWPPGQLFALLHPPKNLPPHKRTNPQPTRSPQPLLGHQWLPTDSNIMKYRGECYQEIGSRVTYTNTILSPAISTNFAQLSLISSFFADLLMIVMILRPKSCSSDLKLNKISFLKMVKQLK